MTTPENTAAPIVIYQSADGSIATEVRLQGETVWLSQEQISQLFGRERSVITKHLRNAFNEGELSEESNVQNLHIANSDKPVKFYNLDVIISVGYRVKSLEGTRFRQWANRVLRDHLIQGYSLNEHRLAQQGLKELEQAVDLLGKTLTRQELVTDIGREVVGLILGYAKTWRLLLEEVHPMNGEIAV